MVSRYYSMGAGNEIGLGITISGPLPPNPPKTSPSPIAMGSDDWRTYSNSEVGLQVRYPPHWHVRDDSPSNRRTQYKYLLFGADNFAPGEFRITVEPRHSGDLVSSSEEEGRTCFPPRYRISGSSATECVLENEVVSEGICERYVQAVAIRTAKYDLTFEPSGGGSFADDSGHYQLLDLYEKIMSTIEIEQSK
ncbi:MAG TPA: hypothetical protein VIX37_09105 [Candidatus Sulfotelmatobacter sp.]